jgi:hypothetical protein
MNHSMVVVFLRCLLSLDVLMGWKMILKDCSDQLPRSDLRKLRSLSLAVRQTQSSWLKDKSCS